ncbi:MAG: class I SAM-dependent methyltransferase [Flavobacteriales bacterium]|nr:class I SAM-dependent methyltransferase [Flavobacteriales bacterium]
MEVKEFFDRIAPTYRRKYTPRNVWHQYFFTERLEEATSGFQLNGKTVLDIGAGTGNLFDFLSTKFPTIEYHGCDISEAMLAHSNIVKTNRHVGRVHELDFGTMNFEVVFMLGVSTYMDHDELEKNLMAISSLLKKGGTLVISFTNGSSLDWKMRAALRWLVALVGGKKRVLSQLKAVARKPSLANAMVANHFVVKENRWLNHTVFPFYLPLKKFSVRIAQWLHPKLQQSRFSSLLSSDVLIIAKKVSG